jgi:hypothetical protein
MYTSDQKKRHQGSTNIWQFHKPKKSKRKWYQKYAMTHDPDTRLLKNWRGKGY